MADIKNINLNGTVYNIVDDYAQKTAEALRVRQNILSGRETGNPVSVDDAFAAPLCGLTIYGKSTQDGTPKPDEPVPIVSAGDSGTVVVTLGDGGAETKTITLSTPGGLPGIPVNSNGNYTDQNGQQWVCNEVDLDRGVTVQRVDAYKILAVKSLQSINSYGIANFVVSREFTDALTIGSWKVYLCNRFAPQRSLISMTKEEGMLINDAGVCFCRIRQETANTVDDMNAWLSRNDVLIYYALATPIETPITPADIAAYKALTAYAPDTVVQASDGAGIKLDYQRDINIVIRALESRLVSSDTHASDTPAFDIGTLT